MSSFVRVGRRKEHDGSSQRKHLSGDLGETSIELFHRGVDWLIRVNLDHRALGGDETSDLRTSCRFRLLQEMRFASFDLGQQALLVLIKNRDKSGVDHRDHLLRFLRGSFDLVAQFRALLDRSNL